jgi:prepilin-type N-terminal cleavage/methylation domain-containing protein
VNISSTQQFKPGGVKNTSQFHHHTSSTSSGRSAAVEYENRNILRNRKSKAKQRRFTLVEMLLVLVILATLAAIVYPKVMGRSEQAALRPHNPDRQLQDRTGCVRS